MLKIESIIPYLIDPACCKVRNQSLPLDGKALVASWLLNKSIYMKKPQTVLMRGIWFLARCFRYPWRWIQGQKVGRPRPEDVIYIDPASIKYQLRNEKRKAKWWIPGEVAAGDWDLDIAPRYGPTDPGYKTMHERFVLGLKWEETCRFQEEIPKKLAEGRPVKSRRTMEGVLDYYYTCVDGLYQDMARNGFRLPESMNDKQVDLIHVYIARNGEIIWSANGNHRLHISKLLGLREIPVRVFRRHKKWHNYRESVRSKGRIDDQYSDPVHPDLKNLG